MTISYDPSSGRWKSRYSYDTSCFDLQDDVMLSFSTGSESGDIAYQHNPNASVNRFYGVRTDSQIKLSFNANPSTNKVYKALSLEGANLNVATSQLTANLSPDPSQASEAATNEGFVEKGGIFYGGVTKVNSTHNENGLKLVGEITLARYIDKNITSPYVINGAEFPFQGVEATDAYWRYIYFDLIPSPHYRALDSASADDVISKYYVGWATNTGGFVVTPFEVAILPFEGDLSSFVFLSNNSVEALGNRIDRANEDTFQSLSDGVHNTDLPPKIGNTIGARVTPAVITQNYAGVEVSELEVLASPALAIAINNYVTVGKENRLFLYKITDDRIDGSDPMGQYADLTLNLGSQDFELFAVNADYSTTPLDHSK